GIETPRNFADLAGKVGGTARQIGDLVSEVAAIAQAIADGVEKRHAGQRGKRHDCRRAGVEFESEIEHRADRGGDKHHADRNENGTDATHAIYPGPSPAARTAADSPSQ